MSHAATKLKHMEQVKRLLLSSKVGMTPTEIAQEIGVSRFAIHRYVKEMPGVTLLEYGKYVYSPTQDEIDLAKLILERAGIDHSR